MLSNADLLAAILTNEPAANIRALADNLLRELGGIGGLVHANAEDLRLCGLGSAQVAQLLAVLELSKRLAAPAPSERAQIHHSADAARLVLDMGRLPQEHIRVILLDSGKRVIDILTLYIGTVNTAVLRAAEIYREAITRNAPAIILAHNHPSGDPTPSPEDIRLTRTLAEAGHLLDIQLVDHLIIGGAEWRSLKDMRLGF